MSKRSRASRERALRVETRELPGLAEGAEASAGPSLWLTILAHPDPARVGEVAVLDGALASAGEVLLSRTAPDFASPAAPSRGGAPADVWPLADPFLSRRPAALRRVAGSGLELSRDKDAVQVVVDGDAVAERRTFSPAELERGVVLELGQRVALLLHLRPEGPVELEAPARSPASSRDADDPAAVSGIIGESAAIHELRRNIARVAGLDVPVLIRGETGTGKELVAQAIHAASARAAAPCLSVNMAAIPASVAASELFGHVKGAFTGAVADHAGLFARADGGTLFLDEIGETPVEVQVMLLRTLETGLVHPVGARGAVATSVRLIAATDARLEALTREGRFRPALLHRLAGYELHLPPLRERKEDLGRLFFHFAREELARAGAPARLDAEAAQPWVPAPLVARLARYSWPGNVRQLRNVARQLVISHRDAPVMSLDRALERSLEDVDRGGPRSEPASTQAAAEPAPADLDRADPSKTPRRKPSEVTEEELLRVLRAHRFKIEPAAEALRLNRASLYMLIDKSPRIRKAKDIPAEELLRLDAELGGDVERMAERLEVSSRGLYLRLREVRESTR